MSKWLALVVSGLLSATTAQGQAGPATPATPTEPPAADGGAPAAPTPAAEPAPAAYQPAVLDAAQAAPTAPDAAAAPPAEVQTQAPATVPSAPPPPRRFRGYQMPAAMDASEQADLVQGRAALLRDQRQAPPAEEEETIRHGDPRARWTIAASIDSVFYTAAGYDLFDDDNVSSRLGLWVAYDLAQLSPRAVVAVELGVGAESEEQGVWQGALRTELESQTYSAGVSLRYALFPWLDPQLRASGGVTRLAFSLDVDDTSFDDHAASGFGALGAGLLLHTPAATFETKRGEFASFTLGFLIEGGYALRSSVDFDPTRKAAAHAIPITQAELGQLALSGPYIRSSILVRF